MGIGVLELVLERLTLTLGERLHESQRVLAADGLDNLIWRCAEELRNDGELVDVVLSGEQGLSLEHFCKDAPSTPDINLHVVLLPSEHNLGCSVVSGRDITGHLGILDTGKAKVANLEVAVLVDKNVAGLQVTVDNSRGVYIFQASLHVCGQPNSLRQSSSIVFCTNQDLVEEVLNELLLKRPRREQAVEVSAEELGDEVTGGCKSKLCAHGLGLSTYMSSRGEMKISLRLMT